MNYEIERKIINQLSLTDEEVNTFLSFICNEIRKSCKIYNPMDTECKKCYETSSKFGRITLIRFGCDVELLDIKKSLQIPLTHYANFITFYIENNKKTYLVDMTYSQFFSDIIYLDNNELITDSYKIFEKIKNKPFVKQLREKGFIELNENILKEYINPFLELCNSNNKEQAYNNIHNILIKNEMMLSLTK